MQPNSYIRQMKTSFCTINVFRMRDLPKDHSLSPTDLPVITFKAITPMATKPAWYGLRLSDVDPSIRSTKEEHTFELSRSLIDLLRSINPHITVVTPIIDVIEKTLRDAFGANRSMIYADQGAGHGIRLFGSNALTLRAPCVEDSYYTGRGFYKVEIIIPGIDEQDDEILDGIIHHPSLDITEFLDPRTVHLHFNQVYQDAFSFLGDLSGYLTVTATHPRKGTHPLTKEQSA